MRRARAIAAATFLSISLGAILAACPARDLTINITETGVASILTACRGFQRSCSAAGSCADDQLLCELVDGECVLRNRCHIGDNSHVTWGNTGKKEGKLLLLSLDGEHLGDASPCFGFDASTCIGDRGCFADKLNDKLDQAIKGGLTFDGFTEQDDALLTFAIFESSDGDEPACDPDRLVACAGLAPPLGGGDFDITCASCQDSSHFALGHDNGPCPTTKTECFLERCERLIRLGK
jgi:hypothetical protein